jgi:DNA-binding NtrC family response regulator
MAGSYLDAQRKPEPRVVGQISDLPSPLPVGIRGAKAHAAGTVQKRLSRFRNPFARQGWPIANRPQVTNLPHVDPAFFITVGGPEANPTHRGGVLPMTPRILIADDQPDVLEALRLLLKPEGFLTSQANSPAAVLALLDNQEFDGAIIDLNYTRDTTSGAEGLDLLSVIQSRDALLPVIVMTAWGSVDIAVEAMRRGARDFIQKPWENARVLAVVKTQLELGRALRTARKLEAEDRVLRTVDRPVFIAESPAMKHVLRVIGDVGPSDANILITGEPGTGKEVVAQTIHAVSQRSSRRLVTVNAGGLSEGVFESELFGHVRGAFTDARSDRVGRFELADGGTLFLDEIANISSSQQARLLRVLQSGELERVGSSRTIKVDVRVLSASNADLNAEVAAGRFRADLLYRLNAIEIHLPPLRDRREDIPPLASYFLSNYAVKYRKQAAAFDAAAMRAMLEHDWPGNVRELQHAIERAVLLAQGDKIQASDFALRGPRTAPRLEELSLEQVESLLIRKAMARYEGNVSKTANALGLSRSALYRRLDRYGIA